MRWWGAALFLLLITAAAAYPIWFGKYYVVGDTRDVFVPLELFFAQQLKSGHLPTWNPNIAFGFPVLAAAQIGVLYPPLLIGRMFPITIYLPALFVLHITAAGLGTWVLLRHLKLRKESALFGAITFMLSAFVWEHTTHLNIIFPLAYVPWQLWVTSWLVNKQKISVRQGIGTTFLFGIPLLIGQFQIQTLSAIVCIAYALYHLPRSVRTYRTTATIIMCIAIGAGLVAAVQLLPTAELAQQSSRSAGGQFDIQVANQHSFPVYHIPTILFPRFFGNDNTYWGKRLEIEFGAFIGTLPLISVLAYISMRRKSNPRLKFFVWTLGISLLLALGSLSPFRLLYIEPTLWIFSAPTRWMAIATFSAAILAAAGFEYALPKLSRKHWLVVGGAIAAIILVGNIILFHPTLLHTLAFSALEHVPHGKDLAYYQDKFSLILESAKTSSISFLSWYTYLPLVTIATAALFRPTRYYQSAIIIVTTIECLLIAATTTPSISWQDALRPPTTLSSLPTNVTSGNARVYSIREGGDEGAYFTDPASRANPAIRSLQRDLLVPLISSQFNIPGIEWPASLDLKQVHQTLSELRGDEGYEIKNPALLHDLAIGAVLTPKNIDVPNLGNEIPSTDSIHIYTTNPSPRVGIIYGNHQELPLAYSTDTPTHMQIPVAAKEPATIIVRDLKYPGWHATIDGHEVEIMAREPFFRSVTMPAGDHIVEFTYTPRSISVGLTISVMTTIVFCAMLILIKPRIKPL